MPMKAIIARTDFLFPILRIQTGLSAKNDPEFAAHFHLSLDLTDEVCYTVENIAAEESRARIVRHPEPLSPGVFDTDPAKLIR